MRHIKYILIVLSIFLSGCLSEEEIKARQENAFNLSGTYQTTGASEVQFNFTVTNQEGKHDILVQVNRTSPLSDKEKGFLSGLVKEHGIPERPLMAQPFPTTFGANPDNVMLDTLEKAIEGGDNISDNFGKTSRFRVCSDSSEYESRKVEQGAKNMKLHIFYCLSGIVKKENKNIVEEGELSLNASYNYEFVDEKEGIAGFSTHPGEAILNYKAEKTKFVN